MMICIDIGNTNIKYAIYDKDELKFSFRVATDLKKTSDEFGAQLTGMLSAHGVKVEDIEGGIISSVVPSLDYTIDRMCDLYLKISPLHIAPGLKSGLNIRCDDAREVGADRLVNCVSAIVQYGGKGKPLIVIDFGTATTFNIISENDEFIGGVISPGIKGSLDSLVNGTAKLPRVEIEAPSSIIAKDTVTNMQAGIVFGFAAVCAVACLALAFGLRVKREKKKPQILASLKAIYGNKNCLRCIIANALSHCRGSTLSLYLTLLVYNLIANEAVIGLRSTLDSTASLLSMVVYGMLVRNTNRTKSSMVATAIVLIPCVGLLLGVNVVTLMIFSVVYAFAGTFLSTPISFTYYNAVKALGMGAAAGAEVQLAADIFVAIASIPGFLIIALVPRTNGWAVAVLLLMILLSVISTLLVRSADRDIGIQKL